MTDITANHDAMVDLADFRFRYRKDRLGNQRPAIEFKAGVPSVEGIIQILEKGGNGLQLLQDAIYDTVASAYRTFLQDNEQANAETLDFSAFTWDAIANQPREDRRSAAITPELWEAFAKDYSEIMPGVTKKQPESIAATVTVYLKKFSIIRTNKAALNTLKGQLALYMEHSPNAEQFQDVLELLFRKCETYLKADETETLVNLL